MEPPIIATFRCICNHFRDFSTNFDAKSESFRENTKTKTFVSTLFSYEPMNILSPGTSIGTNNYMLLLLLANTRDGQHH
jgi:hypothetical protein